MRYIFVMIVFGILLFSGCVGENTQTDNRVPESLKVILINETVTIDKISF
jgi:hypothetical protein